MIIPRASFFQQKNIRDAIAAGDPQWLTQHEDIQTDYGTGSWRGGHPDCSHEGAPSRVQARRAGIPRSCPACHASWIDQQYGLEATPEQYVQTMRAVFDEARRVLAPHGTLWLNLGDGYASGELGRNDARRRYPSLAARQQRRPEVLPPASGLPAKNLLKFGGVPPWPCKPPAGGCSPGVAARLVGWISAFPQLSG